MLKRETIFKKLRIIESFEVIRFHTNLIAVSMNASLFTSFTANRMLRYTIKSYRMFFTFSHVSTKIPISNSEWGIYPSENVYVSWTVITFELWCFFLRASLLSLSPMFQLPRTESLEWINIWISAVTETEVKDGYSWWTIETKSKNTESKIDTGYEWSFHHETKEKKNY
mgnify:CR=1 FL=1